MYRAKIAYVPYVCKALDKETFCSSRTQQLLMPCQNLVVFGKISCAILVCRGSARAHGAKAVA